jgi:hypothetical protein
VNPKDFSFRRRLAEARSSIGLHFATLLDQETITEVFGDARRGHNSPRIYSAAVTLWTFLSQVLSFHHGCVAAVTKLNIFRIARGQRAISVATGAYCIARDKLDEQSMHQMVRHTGRMIEEQSPRQWRWLGHRVIVGDGTTLTMADTDDNQREYPQQMSQKPGCGFPIMRCVVLFALSTGVVLEMAMGRYKGKLTHEVSLFREIDSVVEENDVFLADRAYSGWFEMARLMARGVHVVVRMHQRRKADFSQGVRLGKDDHTIRLDRPSKPEWMSQEEYETYPEFIIIREMRIRVEIKSFRTREIIVHTSLVDPDTYTHEDIAALFRRRWQAELDLRSLKTVMVMDHLRCKKPHRVRNEIRAHMIAYNLIRQVMCEAAADDDTEPWEISFKGTLTTLTEFLPFIGAVLATSDFCSELFRCCRRHIVGHRPDRYEPRVKKRRPKSYPLMIKPRSQYKPNEA